MESLTPRIRDEPTLFVDEGQIAVIDTQDHLSRKLGVPTMAQAQVDPTELRRFAKALNRFNGELQTLVSAQHARLVELGRSWRDQEHRKFSEQLEQTMKTLNRFLETSNEHVSFLMKKAGHIENYLRQR